MLFRDLVNQNKLVVVDARMDAVRRIQPTTADVSKIICFEV